MSEIKLLFVIEALSTAGLRVCIIHELLPINSYKNNKTLPLLLNQQG
tara:strand:- start:217 stop:357 length:141 start_codon:yes stop_codon:yes gene_type:complete